MTVADRPMCAKLREPLRGSGRPGTERNEIAEPFVQNNEAIRPSKNASLRSDSSPSCRDSVESPLALHRRGRSTLERIHHDELSAVHALQPLLYQRAPAFWAGLRRSDGLAPVE